MRLKDEAEWKKWVEANTDSYGRACVEYAERWANLMEAAMPEGTFDGEVARRTSHEANTERITGFMFGAAVTMLAGCWERGEELRRWHNLDRQIGTEGEQANESGGVLNPSVLVLRDKEGR
jgi:hypothetical protein